MSEKSKKRFFVKMTTDVVGIETLNQPVYLVERLKKQNTDRVLLATFTDSSGQGVKYLIGIFSYEYQKVVPLFGWRRMLENDFVPEGFIKKLEDEVFCYGLAPISI